MYTHIARCFYIYTNCLYRLPSPLALTTCPHRLSPLGICMAIASGSASTNTLDIRRDNPSFCMLDLNSPYTPFSFITSLKIPISSFVRIVVFFESI